MNENYGVYIYEISNIEFIVVLFGFFILNKGVVNLRNVFYVFNSYLDKIYVKVMINENYNISLKVDIGVDVCIIIIIDF